MSTAVPYLQVEVDGDPVSGEKYQHTNGQVYIVVFVTNRAHEREDHPPDVVYIGSNGHVWSRRLSDWSRSMTKVANNG